MTKWRKTMMATLFVSFYTVHSCTQRGLEASKKDDSVDENNDGIPDVQQIDSKEVRSCLCCSMQLLGAVSAWCKSSMDIEVIMCVLRAAEFNLLALAYAHLSFL